MGKYYSEEERANLLAKYEKSGKTKSNFARDENISVVSLRRWMKKEKPQEKKEKMWVKTEVEKHVYESISVQIGKVTITVPEAVDFEHLGKVVGVVSKLC